MNCFHCGKLMERPFAAVGGMGGTIHCHVECLPGISSRCARAFHDFKLQNPSTVGVPMKEFVVSQSILLGIKPHSVWMRLKRNPEKHYPNVILTHVNKRVVFVNENRPEASL